MLSLLVPLTAPTLWQYTSTTHDQFHAVGQQLLEHEIRETQLNEIPPGNNDAKASASQRQLGKTAQSA